MANGTIAFDTLSTSGQISGTAVSVDTDYLAYGSAKVWYLASNAASLTDSFNVSSGSDGGTGNYTYNYSNAFANANYSVSGVCGEGSIYLVFNSSRATGSSNNKVGITSGSVTDAQNTGQINGDLA
jgi:hypothetical protein